jgi:cytosine/adenosine deaminase-related metal-dependent hydrolase
MIACRNIAREHDLAMQTHVSEAKYQGVSTFKMFGKSTVEVMDACGLVGPWFSRLIRKVVFPYQCSGLSCFRNVC